MIKELFRKLRNILLVISHRCWPAKCLKYGSFFDTRAKIILSLKMLIDYSLTNPSH
jgi:hypothetical protein